MNKRTAKVSRKTAETDITLELDLTNSSESKLETGIGFLDHMLSSLSKHSCFSLKLSCKGDLTVDDHHTVEDSALCLGEALNKALGERRGIRRFGYAYAPLDEALARAVVDLSGRPFAQINLEFAGDKIGNLSTENVSHFFHSLAMTSRATIHIDVLRGENDHHIAEAAFKALALALKAACSLDSRQDIPSTKGVL